MFLATHLGRLTDGDYFALLAYIEMNEANERALQAIRSACATRACGDVPSVRAALPPLHRPGLQGRADSGVFLQITCDDARDLPVPGQSYTFGVVKAAQARGDFQVLAERNRRALRVHLGRDVPGALSTLQAAIRAALAF